jgi:hypothetical protein
LERVTRIEPALSAWELHRSWREPAIKFLAEVGAAVWFDEYDEVTWERDARTSPG